MVFSSLTFLYLFLPLAVLPYFLVKSRTWRNGLLLVLSLFFYAWGEPKYVVMMLAATVVAYAGGLAIETLRGRPKACKVAFVLTVCLVTANLLVFKYANFLWDTLNSIVSTGVTLPTIALPIGISFYTFQILSYVIDLYWGKVHVQRNFFYLLLYVSFFPQLIAGPIVRYSTIEDEILHRKETWDDVEAGLKRFLLGLAKKVLIANNVAALADMIYQGNQSIYGTALYWLASVAYTMQIYFDFSGYSDMAIGLGRMFGFHFLENFNYPYLSTPPRSFGGGGTSPSPPGSGITSTSRWGAVGSAAPSGCGIFSSSGASPASGTEPLGTFCSGGCITASCWWSRNSGWGRCWTNSPVSCAGSTHFSW